MAICIDKLAALNTEGGKENVGKTIEKITSIGVKIKSNVIIITTVSMIF